MFAQPYGALPPVPTPAPGEADDMWHVAISWDDVKVMSLEQLDDAFRLDIVSSNTPVWQKGMSGWQPLGVVAGIGGDDDEDEEEEDITLAHVEVVFPPFPGPGKPAPARSPRPTPPPPRPPSRAPAPAASSQAPASLWPTLASPPGSRPKPVAPVIPLAPRPAPMTAAQLALVSQPPPPPRAVPPTPVHTATLIPPSGFGAPSALYQAANANAIPRHPPTVPPGAMSVTMPPPMRHRRGSFAGRMGQWLLAFAVVGGLATTLYRNDILLQAARKWNFESQYLSAERAIVGSPGFGTLRSLANLISVDALKRGSPEAAAPQSTTVAAVTAAAAATGEEPITPAAAPDTKSESPSAGATSKTESKAGAIDVTALKLERASRNAEEPPSSTKAVHKPAKASSKPVPRAERKAQKAPAARAANSEAKAALAAIAARKAKLAREAKAAGAVAKVEKDKPKAPEAAPAAPPPPREAPAPVAEKPSKPKSPKSFLDAAIRDSMEKGSFAPKKKKKKSGPNGDYDPMNGDL